MLTVIIGKLSFDVSTTKQAAAKTENNINNRASSLSDRLDDVLEALSKVQRTQQEHGEKLATDTRDLRGVRVDIGALQGADGRCEDVESMNQQLSRHMRETPQWTAMLTELYTQDVSKEGINKTEY